MLDSIALFVIMVVAIYDLWLVGATKPTISRAYQALFPAKTDLIILGVLVIGLCFLPVHRAISGLLGVIIGHVFWANKETHPGA